MWAMLLLLFSERSQRKRGACVEAKAFKIGVETDLLSNKEMGRGRANCFAANYGVFLFQLTAKRKPATICTGMDGPICSPEDKNDREESGGAGTGARLHTVQPLRDLVSNWARQEPRRVSVEDLFRRDY
ncbi:hypothetical protein U1Q18_029965 [Sarracenia purpurea var. burkii]